MKNKEKLPYIELLFNLHDKSKKIIPILESIGNSQEESFIFTITGSRSFKTFLIWENTNPARATYLFEMGSNKKKLNNLLNYISEHESSKRLFLRDITNREWAERELGYIGYVDHDEIWDYKFQVEYLVR